MIIHEFILIPNDTERDGLFAMANSFGNIKYEHNKAYIDRLISKKRLSSAAESIYALSLLDRLALRIRDQLPQDIILERDEYGKPHILNSDVDIGITHTEGLAAVAVSTDGRIGIDAEKIYKKDPMPLAKRFFAENEVAYVENADDAALAFTKIWTEKEAYVKMLGKGLSVALSSFDVTKNIAHFETLRTNDTIITICKDLM